MPLFEQSWLSGTVKNIPYNGLLFITLTETELRIAFVLINIPILVIPLEKISTVAPSRMLFVPKIVVNYFDTTGRFQSLDFRSWKYRLWIEAFQKCNISIAPMNTQM